MTSFPKVIWMFWLQGWEHATELSRLCLRSWRELNPEWEVVPLSRYNIEQYLELDSITDDFYSKKPISCSVDLLNLNLLNQYGGIWIDSTVLCQKPLDSWIGNSLDTGFFAHKFDPPVTINDGAEKPRILSTWFIAADAGHYIIKKWCERYNDYWLGRKEPDFYFDFHYLFYDLYCEDPKIKSVFDKTLSISAQEQHRLCDFRDQPLQPNVVDQILKGNHALTKFQNVYEDNTYEGEEVVQKLAQAKHEKHKLENSDIRGLREMYDLVTYQYANLQKLARDL